MKRGFSIMTAALLGAELLAAEYAECATFSVSTPAEFQAALTAAQSNGQDDTINVVAGTYNLASSLAYTSTEAFDLTIIGAGAATTILDGGNTVQIMRVTNDGGSDISVSGLTFQHGRVSDIAGFGAGLYVLNNGNGSVAVDQCVATNCTAIRNTAGAWLGTNNGSLTVTNSSFTHNSCDEGTSDDGCGLYLYFDGANASGNAIVRNNIISHNTLNHNPSPVGNCDGAGMMIYHLGTAGAAPSITVENNTISNNLSYEGAAGASLHVLHHQATITFTGNTFSDNTAGPLPHGVAIQISGGGLQLYNDGGTIVFNYNKFLGNRNLDPYGLGGGLCIDNIPSGSLRMIGNVFAGNQNAGIGGGALVNFGAGVTSAYIAENLFVNNQAGVGASEGSGGGLSIGSGSDIALLNNTFYNNSADSAGGLGYYAESSADSASLFNEIFWGNTPNSLEVFGAGPVSATYSNIDGGTGQPFFGAGCIDADPLFFNAATPPGADGIYATIDDGLHLTAASPSFNTGSNAAVPAWLTLDIAGQPRTQGGTVDMGAYEGVAGTPTAYELTIEVSPADGGTTTPAAGTTLELTSPQAIAALANANFAFESWEVVEGTAAVQSAVSASTNLIFSSNCRVRANFAEIPATAALTIEVYPAEGGTTMPVVGLHTVATQVPHTISAFPAEGYNFTGWTKTGQVTLGSASQATTTATLLGNATVRANFVLPPSTVNLMFIHHSVGQNWLDQGLRAALDAKEYIDEVNEITYNDVVQNDAGRPDSLPTPDSTAGDHTDVSDWLYWFNDYFGSIRTFGCAPGGTNRIIMFKSCFPNSHIESAGSGNGDPFDSYRTIANYQAVFRNAAGAGTPYTNNGYNYLALEDVFAANPEVLFVYVTAPPESYADATANTGKNARTFNDWLKQTWLPAYNAAHPGLNNVQIFDFFDVLANADTGALYSNRLKDSYGGSTGDSHPNETANQNSTVIYATGQANFIDAAFGRFTGSAPQIAVTMASLPADGGTTVPAPGAASQYLPLVIAAEPAEGFTFTDWTISVNGIVYNTQSPVTTLLSIGAVSATANFAAARYMTLGSLGTYTVDDVEDFPGESFGRKPAMSAGYLDPTSAQGRPRKASLKTGFNSAQSQLFTAEWTKKQPIFNKKSIPQGTDSRTFIGAGLSPLLCYETEVKATANTGQKGTFNAGTILIPAPDITAVLDSNQAPIPAPVTVAPGATVYLVGNFYGCKVPNVWFEYDSDGRIKQLKCKVLKNLITGNDYPDSKGRPSCMNCISGASRVPVQIPAANKIPDGGVFNFIVIDNGVGRDTYDMTVE